MTGGHQHGGCGKKVATVLLLVTALLWAVRKAAR